MDPDWRVRPAQPDECDDVLFVLEGALLEIEPERVRSGVASGAVLVAVGGGSASSGGDAADGEEHVLGALVCDGDHVVALAVRPRRRRQGIGTALVRAAAAGAEAPATDGSLTADFDERARPFYEALGFAIERLEDGRFRGRHPTDRSV